MRAARYRGTSLAAVRGLSHGSKDNMVVEFLLTVGVELEDLLMRSMRNEDNRLKTDWAFINGMYFSLSSGS